MCGASPETISRIRLLVPGSRSRGAVGTKNPQLRGAFETTAGWSRDLIAKDLTGGTSSGEIATAATKSRRTGDLVGPGSTRCGVTR